MAKSSKGKCEAFYLIASSQRHRCCTVPTRKSRGAIDFHLGFARELACLRLSDLSDKKGVVTRYSRAPNALLGITGVRECLRESKTSQRQSSAKEPCCIHDRVKRSPPNAVGLPYFATSFMPTLLRQVKSKKKY